MSVDDGVTPNMEGGVFTSVDTTTFTVGGAVGGCSLDCSTTAELVIITDNYGSETSWTFKSVSSSQSACSIDESGGQYSSRTTYTETLSVCKGESYEIEMFDSYGDGKNT